MRLRYFNVPLLLAMACAGFPPAAVGQSSSSNGTGPESIRLQGSVVDSSTGEPIRGALVEVTGPESRAMRTGADGRFDFEGLPPGDFGLHPRKPGYFNLNDVSEAGGSSENIHLASASAPLILKLIPEGIIYGRITADNGEPIEGITVGVSCVHFVNGRRQTDRCAMNQTHEDGDYRIAGLMPGTYFVSAGPSEQISIPVPEQPQHPATGYALTFYPSTSDIESAAPIVLRPGTHAEADMALTAQPLYEVSGTVRGCRPGENRQVNFFDSSGNVNSFQAQVNDHSDAFRARSVPPGSYLVCVFCEGAREGVFADLAAITVTSNIANLHFNVTSLDSIPVVVGSGTLRITPDEGHGLASVHLAPARSFAALSGAQPTFDSEVREKQESVDFVLPGSYIATFRPAGPWYVASATYGSTNLLRDPLVLAKGNPPDPIEIELREDGASLVGTVVDDGRPAVGSVLLLSDSAPNQPLMVATDAQGRFQFTMLAPGNYNAIAFDRINNLEYANPRALLQYAGAQKAVILTPSGKSTIQLDLVHRGD